MGYSHKSLRTMTFSANGTTSTALEIDDEWDSIVIDIPTLSPVATFKIQGSVDGTNYRDIYDTTGANQLLNLPSGAGNRSIGTRDAFDALGFRYIQAVLGVGTTAALTVQVLLKKVTIS